MKGKLLLAAAAIAISSASAHSQYYEIANQLPGLIRPALAGGLNYKGYVEAHYLQGVGSYQANFLGASTSQGFRYSSFFFMGAGLGIDYVFTQTDNNWGDSWSDDGYNDYYGHASSKGGVMIPIFTDFRFNVGKPGQVNFTAGVKIGCSFLMGNNYIRINNGYLTNSEYFYLRPTLGVRIPVNSKSPKQNVNLEANYQLLTSNYWSAGGRNVTLSALGISASYEW